MGQTFDNNGRTPLHYCAEKFHEFCQKNQVKKKTSLFEDKNKIKNTFF